MILVLMIDDTVKACNKKKKSFYIANFRLRRMVGSCLIKFHMYGCQEMKKKNSLIILAIIEFL